MKKQKTNIKRQKRFKPHDHLLLLAVTAGSVALANDAAGAPNWGLGDPHLTVVPRTDAESARINAVTAPTTDFTSPQRFEERPGGAATVRVFPDANAFSQPSGNMSFVQAGQWPISQAVGILTLIDTGIRRVRSAL